MSVLAYPVGKHEGDSNGVNAEKASEVMNKQ